MSSVRARARADRAFPSRRRPRRTRRFAPEAVGAISVGDAILVRRIIQNEVLRLQCHSRESGNPGPPHVRPSLDARLRRHDSVVSETPALRLGTRRGWM
jgi:hypothetical protein